MTPPPPAGRRLASALLPAHHRQLQRAARGRAFIRGRLDTDPHARAHPHPDRAAFTVEDVDGMSYAEAAPGMSPHLSFQNGLTPNTYYAGFVTFEVPEEAAEELTLVYSPTFVEETYEIELFWPQRPRGALGQTDDPPDVVFGWREPHPRKSDQSSWTRLDTPRISLPERSLQGGRQGRRSRLTTGGGKAQRPGSPPGGEEASPALLHTLQPMARGAGVVLSPSILRSLGPIAYRRATGLRPE